MDSGNLLFAGSFCLCALVIPDSHEAQQVPDAWSRARRDESLQSVRWLRAPCINCNANRPDRGRGFIAIRYPSTSGRKDMSGQCTFMVYECTCYGGCHKHDMAHMRQLYA